jgi:hypothetical protein
MSEIYVEIFSCTIYMCFFYIAIINENSLFYIVPHMSHKDTEQITIERSFYNTQWHNTDWLTDQVITEWMTSVCWGIPVSADMTFWEAPWTPNKPAQWTLDIWNMDLQEFRDERASNRQTIHNLMNKLRSTGSLIEPIQKYKHWVLTKEKSDDIGAKLEHTPTKSLKSLAQEAGVSKSSARRATQLTKLRPYKITVVLALQPHKPASRLHF